MIGVLLGVAGAVDAFAAGVWLGHKWGAATTVSKLQSLGVQAAPVIAKVDKALAPVITKIDAIEDRVEAAIRPAPVAPIAVAQASAPMPSPVLQAGTVPAPATGVLDPQAALAAALKAV